MLLLDANVIGTAYTTLYPMGRFPEYWEWIVHQGERSRHGIPNTVWEELLNYEDDTLRDWLKGNKESLWVDDERCFEAVGDVLEAYDADEADLEILGADPFLIAFAIVTGETIVTYEVSKPSKTGKNRKIPDVCNDLGVNWIPGHDHIVVLDFSTDWKVRG